MGLTMSQRTAVTKAMALRYSSASKTDEATMLAELCADRLASRSRAQT
jgi:hypothetical protein